MSPREGRGGLRSLVPGLPTDLGRAGTETETETETGQVRLAETAAGDLTPSAGSNVKRHLTADSDYLPGQMSIDARHTRHERAGRAERGPWRAVRA